MQEAPVEEEDAKNKRRVVPRAEICRVLAEEGHDCTLDAQGNVVVRCPPDLEDLSLPIKELHQRLGIWRKSIHRRVGVLSRGDWVSVKGPAPPVAVSWCRRCLLSMAGPCRCGCEEDSHHCATGDACRPTYTRLYDTVVVCALSVVPRSKLNMVGIQANYAVIAAEMLLMDRKKGGVWKSFPIDVALLVLNIVLKDFKLHLRRARRSMD